MVLAISTCVRINFKGNVYSYLFKQSSGQQGPIQWDDYLKLGEVCSTLGSEKHGKRKKKMYWVAVYLVHLILLMNVVWKGKGEKLGH